ncbi:sigma 54-interacting transcriptional regulator [Clostridium neuense]|uniref:Sigma 54-interacting transcriptional regulator n=1 Tax=Clostridium neuense TaxID=1728934 RepID=A0ABW8TJ85_9CLOT
MTNKENIMKSLRELSLKIDGEKECGVTAKDISDSLGLQRNIVSHLLNVLNKEEKAIKINTRPVYFIDMEVYKKRKGELKLVTNCLESKKGDAKEGNVSEVFKKLIGYNGSLKYVVDQCKSAVLYPPMGLPILLIGSSGVGKSFLAQIIYEFAKASNSIESPERFVIFNCAEYANNPELLSATLFGSVKGAYTGAERDRPGLIEEADGGVLFLDEIHRLPPEGQEKLFLFLDKGVFRRLGEAERWRSAKVRMIFATTENPKDNFLETFLRRIPLIVKIPSFQERPLSEKLEIIQSIYKKEAITIKKDILVSNKVINILLKSKSGGNIGGLINVIKLSCASALEGSSYKTIKVLKIKINNLPIDFMENFDGILSNVNFADMFISSSGIEDTHYFNKSSSSISDLTSEIFKFAEEFKENDITQEEFFRKCLENFNKLVDEIIFNEIDKRRNAVMFGSIKKITENILVYIESEYGIKYFANSSEIITYIVIYFMEYYNENEEDINELIDYMSEKYPKEYKIVTKIIETIETNLDIALNKILNLYMLIYIKSFNQKKRSDRTSAVLIAHGYSTASSIASVANRMLGEYIFEAIDMPLELSTPEIVTKLNSYIRETNISNGLIILVDMGSLESIYKGITKEFYGDLAIINNISTYLALDVGSRILNSESVEQIAKEAVKGNVSKYNYIPLSKNRKNAIITTCLTGIGAAKKIKDLMDKCFTNDEVEVIAYDYEGLEGNGKEGNIFKQYDVRLIIGTSDPSIEDVPYISVEDFIMKKGESLLKNALRDVVDIEVIDKINREVVKLFTLENVINYLTILNPSKIIDQVENALYNLEIGIGFKLPNDLKISLYIHISCMLERLVIKDPIMNYNKSEEFLKYHIHFIELVKKAFSVIEQFYKVEIPISEIGFIYDSIKNKVSDFKL